LAVTVTSTNGQYVKGLAPTNFIVLIDEQPGAVVAINEEDVPVSTAILLDASASVGYRDYARRLKILREAVAKFVAASNPANEYFVIGFNKQPQLLLDWTSDPKAIVEAIGSAQTRGTTAFYDACYLGIEKLHRGRHDKRAMILISDGSDNNSHYKFRDLLELLKGSDVLLYSVKLFYDDAGASWLAMEGEKVLNELSVTSGGKTFSIAKAFSLRADATLAFQTIAYELRNQYRLTVKPPISTGKNKWRQIKVRIELPGNAPREMKHLTARARQGYYGQ
jgi:Ca-activated chloride channel family protein